MNGLPAGRIRAVLTRPILQYYTFRTLIQQHCRGTVYDLWRGSQFGAWYNTSVGLLNFLCLSIQQGLSNREIQEEISTFSRLKSFFLKVHTNSPPFLEFNDCEVVTSRERKENCKWSEFSRSPLRKEINYIATQPEHSWIKNIGNFMHISKAHRFKREIRRIDI